MRTQTIHRSSSPVVFCKKDVLKNFAKFTGKRLYQSLFFNKVAGLMPTKEDTLALVFSCEYCKIFKNIFFTGHLQWLLLNPLNQPNDNG